MGMGTEGKGPQKSVSYFSGTSMKRTGANGTDMIVRYDQGKIITVDHKKKTYTEMTLEQLQQKINEAAKAMNENKEQMEALRKMMGQSFGPVSVTKQGPGETIAGYATEKYLVKGPMEMQIWAAPDLKIPGAYYDIDEAQRASESAFRHGEDVRRDEEDKWPEAQDGHDHERDGPQHDDHDRRDRSAERNHSCFDFRGPGGLQGGCGEITCFRRKLLIVNSRGNA